MVTTCLECERGRKAIEETLLRWRGALLDHHNIYHDGPFDHCAHWRCYEWRWWVYTLNTGRDPSRPEHVQSDYEPEVSG